MPFDARIGITRSSSFFACNSSIADFQTVALCSSHSVIKKWLSVNHGQWFDFARVHGSQNLSSQKNLNIDYSGTQYSVEGRPLGWKTAPFLGRRRSSCENSSPRSYSGTQYSLRFPPLHTRPAIYA